MTEKALPQAEAIAAVYNAIAFCDHAHCDDLYDKKHMFFQKIRNRLLKRILENHDAIEQPDGNIVIDGWRVLLHGFLKSPGLLK